jgi:hypothetical protein
MYVFIPMVSNVFNENMLYTLLIYNWKDNEYL